MKEDQLLEEFSFPRLIVVPLSCHEVDGVRKVNERLTAAGSQEEKQRVKLIQQQR